jgi:hypothetical protein
MGHSIVVFWKRDWRPKPVYWPNTRSAYRDNVIFWSKDLSRSIDYLETRQDIKPKELAYEGDSWGTVIGGFSRLLKLASGR